MNDLRLMADTAYDFTYQVSNDRQFFLISLIAKIALWGTVPSFRGTRPKAGWGYKEGLFFFN